MVRNRKAATAAALAAVASALALAAAGSPALAAGGWTPTSISGSNGDNVGLNGAFARTSTDAWVVGQLFGLPGQPPPPPVTYHWNGSTWSPVPVPALVAANALTAVSASSASDAWAVGFEVLGRHHRQAVLEHWNGSAWSPNTSGAVAAAFNITLTGVADLSPVNAWAVAAGSESQGLAHWDGTAWNFASFPDPNFSPSAGQAISASSASDVWVVGSTFNTTTFASIPEAEHFNGTTWNTVALAQPGGSAKLAAVVTISPANAWAAGEVTSATSPVGGGTLIEHWNGSSWSVVPSPTPGFEPQLSGIAARSASDVIAVGDTLPTENGGPEQDVILRFNGSSWSSDISGTQGFLGAAAAAPGGAEEFAVGNSSGSTGVILSHP
jgi:hypothetical protein